MTQGHAPAVGEYAPNGQAAVSVAALMQAIATAEGDVSMAAVPSGFPILDRVLDGGFHAGDLVLVGGAPGIGKTVVTLQWARNMASAGHPVVYISYEHDPRSLFARLVLMELGELPKTRRGGAAQLRRVVNALARGELAAAEYIEHDVRLRAAWNRVAAYAEALTLVRGTATTDAAAMRELVDGHDGRQPVLFVDYLQKVPVPGSDLGEEQRASRLGQDLKDLAMAAGTTVVAVTAGNRAALTVRRLRLEHLRGSAGLAYEADVVVMLNEKLLTVSKAHTAFNSVLVDEYRARAVFTIEKNRDGPAPVDLEFRKDFGSFRFDPDGSNVAERLVDDRLVLD